MKFIDGSISKYGEAVVLGTALTLTESASGLMQIDATLSGESVVLGTGTINTLAKFTDTDTIGDSSITDTGSLVTVASGANVHIANTDDVSVGSWSGALRIGTSGGDNMLFDANEIMQKSNDTTAGTLFFQQEGGTVQMFGATDGVLQVNSAGNMFRVASTGAVTSGSWTATAIGTTYGGTGSDLSAMAQGSVLVCNSIGVLSVKAGTVDGQVLTYTLGTDQVDWAVPTGMGGSGTTSYVPYFSASTTLADSPLRRDATDEMFFEDVDVVTIDSVDATNVHLKLYSFLNGPGGSNFIDGFAASVKDAPTGISYNNQVMLGLAGFGHTGTGYGEGGRIYIRAAANWSSTVFSTEIAFYTRLGNGTLTEQWVIEANGDINDMPGTNTITAGFFVGDGSGLTNIGVGAPSGILPTEHGGTGQDWSAAAKGSVPVFNAIGTMSLESGVSDGEVLTYTSGTDTIGWATPAGETFTGSVSATYIPYASSADVFANSPLTRVSATAVRMSNAASVQFQLRPSGALAYGFHAVYGYHTTAYPRIYFYNAQGSESSETAVSGQGLGALFFYGHDGTTYEPGAVISASASGTWGTGGSLNHACYITFNTRNTSDGSTTARWRIQADGDLEVIADSAYDIGTSSTRPATIYADQFNGAGGSLTALNASNISSGTLAAARGGTGQDFSAAAKGSVIVINTAGTMSIESGSVDGQVLTYTLGTDTVGFDALPSFLTGTGTTGFIPYWTTGGSVLGDSPLERGTATLVKGDIDFETYGPAAGVGGVDSTTRMYAYGTGITPIYRFQQARGFRGSESATAGSDVIGQIRAHGYDGSGYQEGARISFVSSGTWSGSVRTALISFWTRNTSGSLTEQWRISPTGTLYPVSALDLGSSSNRLSVIYVNEINADASGATDPSYMFNGATTTGMYYISGPGLGFTTSGVGRVEVSSTAMYPVTTGYDLGTTSLKFDAYLQNALVYGQSYPGSGCYVLSNQTGTLNLNWNNGQVQIVTIGVGALTINPDNSSNMFEGGTYSLMVHGPASSSQNLTIGNVDNWVGTSYSSATSISNGDVVTITFIKQRNRGDSADLVEAIVRLDNVAAGVP
jgi:hypothetical protein